MNHYLTFYKNFFLFQFRAILPIVKTNGMSHILIKTVVNDHNANQPADESFDFKAWVNGIEVLGHYETELINTQAPSLGTHLTLITIDALDNQIID